MSLNPSIRDWRGKRVWIVGASTGIGAALALQLAHAGARLALSARSKDKLEALAAGQPDTQGAASERSGSPAGAGQRDAMPGALVLPLDVRDAAALATAYATIIKKWGGADVTIFNAGTYSPMRADAFDLAHMNEHFAVNFHGVTNGLAAILPDYLLRAAGHPCIGIVSSVAGYRGLPQSLAYGPSKAALINLAETLYLDLAPKGIAITLINPGFVDTPLTKQNTFKMPALIPADEAAREIIAGFARGEFEIHFPKRFTNWLKAMRLLPYSTYFAAIRKSTGP
jgi:NAD(P)-dependent dehydrogenase (short-subunit alcohol dehydrogenase family)